MNVAIDGPAGAGKSTIAKLVSKRLGYIYVDTGAMYRAIALYLLNNNIDVNDEEKLQNACKNITISIQYENQVQQVILNGDNVSELIRTEEVGNMASNSATKACVREKLLQLQRSIAKTSNVVMDGRDIGTNVLVDAKIKVYLTASSKERASRRYKQLMEKGINANIDEIEADIIKRDNQDMNREIAPLKQADDAKYIDSSNMSIDEVVSLIISYVVG